MLTWDIILTLAIFLIGIISIRRIMHLNRIIDIMCLSINEQFSVESMTYSRTLPSSSAQCTSKSLLSAGKKGRSRRSGRGGDGG